MADETSKPIDLVERKGPKMRRPFVPMTGNPEAHDYGDYRRHLVASADDEHIVPAK